MSFPFKFVKSNGNYDFGAFIANVAANGAVVAVGGVSLALIAALALKALGFSNLAIGIVAAIPISISLIGIAVSVAVIGLVIKGLTTGKVF